MKKFFNWYLGMLVVGLLLSMNACKKDDEPQKRPYNEITSFEVKSGDVSFETVINKAKATIAINVAPDRTDLLKDITPSIEVSVGATISPSQDVKQDFTKTGGVKYTVTAENGSEQVWTVTMNIARYLSYGFGEFKTLWQKDNTKDELSDLNKPGIATFDDYLIVARSAQSTAINLFDGNTGDKVEGKTLNTEGITGGNYMLANDDAGNLIGCSLNAFLKENLQIFKWSSLDKAPVSFITAPSKDFGRKLSAVGDVNAKAIVSTFDVSTPGTTADHYVWQIEGGNAKDPEKIAGTISKDIYQMMTPVSADAVKPYYLIDRGASDANPITSLKLVDGLGIHTIKGPVPDSEITGDKNSMFKQTGFGRKVLQVKMFSFNKARYVAILSYFDKTVGYKYYLSLYNAIDGNNPSKWNVFETMEFNGDFSKINPNGTAGLATSKVKESEDGLKTMNLYVFMSGTGVKCFKLTNLPK